MTKASMPRASKTGASKTRATSVLLLCCGFMCQAVANDIELSISDEIIDLRFTADYEQDFSGTLALLHADHKKIKSDQASYTFATRGKVERVDVSLGARLFFLDAESEDGFGAALGIGGQTLLADKFSVSGQVYYSPEIITGGDFESTLDLEIRVNYQLIENGSLYVGYRSFEVDSEKFGSFDIYEDPYIGIKFTF